MITFQCCDPFPVEISTVGEPFTALLLMTTSAVRLRTTGYIEACLIAVPQTPPVHGNCMMINLCVDNGALIPSWWRKQVDNGALVLRDSGRKVAARYLLLMHPALF